MAKKVSELSKDERRELFDECSVHEPTYVGDDRPPIKGYGLCSSCIRAQLVSTQYGVRKASCDFMNIQLSTANPITECTDYFKRGGLSLRDMWNMATLIDGPQDKIGFKLEDKKDD
uniref:Uncharacterized protein n=1 Tax=viral metagenome TaxID=1070528 RepID=A0A6M3IS98_9ZZZZ